MSSVFRQAWVALLLAAALTTTATAQQSPDNQQLTDLQTKSSLTPEEQTWLNNWVAERVRALGTDQPGAGASYVELRKAYLPTASAAFKEGFARAATQAVRVGYLRTSPAGAARMMTVINMLDEVDPTTELLIAALRDERVPVRAAAAVGLARLRRPIATAGGTYFSNTVNALRDAAKQEQAAVVLLSIYRALNFPAVATPPDQRAIAVALLDVLETRAAKYLEARPAAEGADFAAIELAGQLRNQLDEAQRDRLANAIAKIMSHSARRYIDAYGRLDPKSRGPIADTRDRIEKTIVIAERELKRLINPEAPPNLTQAMMETSEILDKVAQMRIQLTDWANTLRDRHGINVQLAENPTDGG